MKKGKIVEEYNAIHSLSDKFTGKNTHLSTSYPQIVYYSDQIHKILLMWKSELWITF